MKTSKIITSFAVLVAFVLTSCVHLGNLDFAEIPDITFSYVWNCPTLDLTACDGATDVSWELPDLGVTGSGNTFSYSFDKAGSYWVVMKAKYNGKDQVYSGVLSLGKTSVIDLNDKSLDDWAGISDQKFICEVDGALLNVKYDFDSDYIYIYYENDEMGGTLAPGAHVVQTLMDNDGCTSSSDFGWKYNFEGCPAGDSPYADIGNTNWESYGDPTLNAGIIFGTSTSNGGVCKCEFGIKRSVFGINKDGFAFRFSIIDPIPWSTKGRAYSDKAAGDNVMRIDLTVF